MNVSAITNPRPAHHPAALPEGANIVTIASGKGGVGKTWLAITLSHVLARSGRRVLLFDGDLGLANIDIQLGLMPERDLGAVITGDIRLDQAATAFGPGGFDIIAGKSGSGALAMMTPARLADLGNDLAGLARRYDWVVADLGAGIDVAVRTLSANGGPKLVVATSEPTALTDAYAFIKVVHGRHSAADLRIVVNMAETAADGERTYAKLAKVCQSFLKIAPPLAGVVCRDPNVTDAIRRQTPLLTRHPTSPALVDVEAVARRLTAAS